MALLRTIPCSTQLSTKQHFEFEYKKHSSTIPFLSSSSSSSSSSFHSLRLSISHTPTTLIRTKQHSNSTLRFTSISEQVTTQEQQQATEEQKEEELSPTRLLVQNIPFTSTAEDLRTLFEKYGKVVDVELSKYGKNKNKHRGFAFVEMSSPEEALAALNSLQSYEFEGRVINLKYARPKKEKTLPSAERTLFVGNLSFGTRAKDLREFFDSGTSKVVSADVVFRATGSYGFVSFKTKKEADEALSEFQGKILLGRPIRVAPVKQTVKPA
ncbi:hypothetical protein P8452_23035 [Trifolium repens]|nr:hypothetical protein P8452_23035 [Trifolium repens]